MTATLSPRPLRLSGGAVLAGVLLSAWVLLASSATSGLAPAAATSAIASSHSVVCKCAHCPGESHCCCGKSGAPKTCPR